MPLIPPHVPSGPWFLQQAGDCHVHRVVSPHWQPQFLELCTSGPMAGPSSQPLLDTPIHLYSTFTTSVHPSLSLLCSQTPEISL